MNGSKKYYFGKNKFKLNMNLVAYFPFNGDVGEKTGISNSGTTSNTTYVAGVLGTAINFNNAAAQVSVGSSSFLNFTLGGGVDIPFSISVWVYVTTFSSVANFLVNKRGDTTNTEWQVSVDPSGQIRFTKFSGGGGTAFQQARTASGTITSGSWFHVVCTDNGSKTFAGMKIYVNKVQKTLTDGSVGTYTGMVAGTSIMRFGMAAYTLDAASRHIGSLDAIGIWKNRALNQNEITFLNNSGSGREYPY